MTRTWWQRAAIGVAGALGCCVVAGCDGPSTGRADGGPRLSASSPIASGGASGRALPSASAGAERGDSRIGRWTATYRARRAEVEIPRGLPGKTWQQDDGTSSVGAGRIELWVEETKLVRGTAEGPLGKLVLRGMVDDDVLRVGVTPADPAQEPAFGGVLVAGLEQDVFVGELRVANANGAVVRASDVRISRPEAFRAPSPPAAAEASAQP